MDISDIIRAAPEASKVVAAIAGSDLVRRMLGPAVDELGERWKDRVRLYRYGRQISCVKKAEKIAKDAGFTPKAVPIKLLFPLLEGASLEEDETLHDMWAALLANASSPDDSGKVRPGFIAILKQMAPDEAALLKTVEELSDGHFKLLQPQSFPSKAALDRAVQAHNFLYMTQICERFPKRDGEEKEEATSRLETCILILENMGLVDSREIVVLTAMGGTFLNACRPPRPKT